MQLEAEVIKSVRERLNEEMKEANLMKRLAQRRGNQGDEEYHMGRQAAFDFALQIIETEMGRLDLE